MSLEPAPAEEGEDRPAGSLDPQVDELLRRLLVGELELKVDPVSGRALPDGEPPARKDRP